jgi:predicted GIY-YIG superfamily endonuclease
MSQLLLLPDPRPLVEKLGAGFFQSAPASPGVYMMRDPGGVILYVGKAKDLRKRLCSYRVANPDRMRKRHLRLLSRVASIEFELCPSEAVALERESHLIRTLKPRFNRAGTWKGPDRYLTWRVEEQGIWLGVKGEPGEGEHRCGPMGASAVYLRAVLVRLLWAALNPGAALSELPAGWFAGHHGEEARVVASCREELEKALLCLEELFSFRDANLQAWIQERCGEGACAFDKGVLASDLEYVQTALESLKRKAAKAFAS